MTSTLREEYTMHGLHLNSPGNGRLTHLAAETVSGSHVPNMSNMHVIIHAKASSILASNHKHRRYLERAHTFSRNLTVASKF
jgi:hypothetical protein